MIEAARPALKEGVRPLAPSLKAITLPEVVVKLALGAASRVNGDQVEILFEGESIRMHQEDFDLASRVSARVRAQMPKRLSPGGVIKATALAHKGISDELFRPGAVRVLYYSTMSKASAFYRCLMPMYALNMSGKAVAHASAARFGREALDYDVVVIQIDNSPSALEFVKALQGMGKKVVYEVDDAFDCLEPWHPQYASYGQPARQAAIQAMMRQADAVQVSTQWLANRYCSIAHRIEVVPNMVELAAWPKADRLRRDGLWRVLWAGSPSHSGDLAEVVPALGRFARAHPDVRIVLFGQEIKDDRIPAGQVENIPWCEFEEYPFKLAAVDADVAIAPLADIPFNCGKCVSPNTYICTPSGMSSIGRIVEHRSHDSTSNLEVEVFQKTGFKKTSHSYYHNPVRTLKVTTKLGYSIEGTPEHKVLDASGEWKPLESFSSGSKVALLSFPFSNHKKTLRLPSWRQISTSRKYEYKGKTITKVDLPESPPDETLFPEISISGPLSELIGGILGDGHLSRGHFGITCFSEDLDVVHHYAKLIHSLGMRPRAHKINGVRAIQVLSCSKNFSDLLVSVGLASSEYKKQFSVPDSILRSPKDVVAAFIRGLFESDATVHPSGITFATKSMILSEQVHLLLLGFGITSRLYPRWSKKYKRDYYYIDLRRAETDTYSREIGFIGSRKKKKLSAVVSKPHSNAYSPISMVDEVADLRESFSEVLDLTVPDGNSYWANGFLSHNSNLRILQYWATGYPVIASDVGPYRDAIVESKAGLLCRTEEDWSGALESTYRNTPSCGALSMAGGEVVKAWDVIVHAKQIEAFYSSLTVRR